MNQTSFKQTTQFKKGEYGEEIAREWLEHHGYLIYKCVTNGAHLIDFIAIKGKHIMGVPEIKTKARRNKYPDTGCNYEHFKQYKEVEKKHNMKVLMIFVDEMLGEMYCGLLGKLSETYYDEENDKMYPSIEPTKNGTKIIYFPLIKMKRMYDLTEKEVLDLKLLSERNYDYAKGNLDNA